jgi:hypothetical protein
MESLRKSQQRNSMVENYNNTHKVLSSKIIYTCEDTISAIILITSTIIDLKFTLKFIFDTKHLG